jgi:hypothetical protein
VTVKVRGAPAAIMFDGDSFNNRPLVPDNVPTLLPAALKWPSVNKGQNSTLSQLWKTGTEARVSRYANMAEVTVYHLMIGVNDIDFGLPGATVYANKVEMADTARDAGFTFIVSMTTPPYSGISGGEETARDALNAAMLADAEDAFDLVVDLTGNANMENPAGSYYADGLHWSATGSAAYTAIAAPLIAAMVAGYAPPAPDGLFGGDYDDEF